MPTKRLLVFCAALLAACSAEEIAPTSLQAPAPRATTTATSPNFLPQDPSAPTIANPVVSFWARKGTDRSVSMYFHSMNGKDSVLFMMLRVRPKSLWLRPNGTAFANGDSILITATLVDPATMAVDFQPSGLRFTPSDPARLKFSYESASDDLNGDGTVNSTDTTLQKSLRIWKRETTLDPWQSLVSKVSTGIHEVEAEISGFTGYVIAW